MNAWLLGALVLGASLAGAALALLVGLLGHRYRTRQLNRRWAAIARALRQGDPQ